MSRDIPLFKIYWDDRDVEKVTSVIKRGMRWANGPDIKGFEERIAEYIGVEYAVAVNSGTSALHAALAAHGIREGDEVIVPSFTFVATANAPLFVGAKPVFTEIEENTYGLDPEDVERKITTKTKAIIPVHYGGLPCRIRELKEIAQRHNLILIEDAAESLGAMVNTEKVGSFGDASALSFCQNKIISTGEGGAILTNSTQIYNKLKLIRSHGRPEISDYFSSTNDVDYVDIGYNFRMPDIIAALGISQLGKIDKIIEMRRSNAGYMNHLLSQIDEIAVPAAPDGFYHVYQAYTIRLKGNSSLREKLKQFLSEKGIMTKVYFHPVHLTQFYRQKFGWKQGDLPVTERIASEVLTLPMFPALTRNEMNYVTQQIKAFFTAGGGNQ